jgi:glycerol-3-phosphate dehydrogenase (NAD(P)+)
MSTIAVLGAGSYGTALAIQLARLGNDTRLWGRDAAHLHRLEADRVNAEYLPGCKFPPALKPVADLRAAVQGADDVLLAVPSHALHPVLRLVAPMLGPGQGIASAVKGLEPDTGKLVHEVVQDVVGRERKLAVISGPTFAKEVGLGMPTAVTVASSDPAYAEHIVHALHGQGFRAYTSDDVIGVEVGGSVKNVLAIAVGIADGLGLGANTRAGVITRGLAEIMRLGEALGGRRETFMGLAGLGDLVLTCTGDLSRNRRLGLALGKGQSIGDAVAAIGQVVESVQTADEVIRLGDRHEVDLPISTLVQAVLHERITPAEGLKLLLSREQKPEYPGGLFE